jgi:hypothetical protein
VTGYLALILSLRLRAQDGIANGFQKIAVVIARAVLRGQACDLSASVDRACGQQMQRRVGGDQRVEVGRNSTYDHERA